MNADECRCRKSNAQSNALPFWLQLRRKWIAQRIPAYSRLFQRIPTYSSLFPDKKYFCKTNPNGCCESTDYKMTTGKKEAKRKRRDSGWNPEFHGCV
jgi:hypothetical protein